MSTESMWEKVLTRDAAADGRFVYAVRSTHIYCRPTCPSKRPGRDQVEFFANPKDAEEKGYRACRRCAPKTESRASHVARICRELADEYKNFGPEEIAQHEGIPLRRMNDIFRSVLGVTVREYLASAKLDDFKKKIKASGDVTGSMYEAGFGSSSRLYEKSDAVLGMTPASYGKGGRGATIHFGLRKTSLGHVLAATTAGFAPSVSATILRNSRPLSAKSFTPRKSCATIRRSPPTWTLSPITSPATNS